MKSVLIGICIAFFVAIALQGVKFMNTSEIQEGFKTSPVTRATDCNCLPGYIPSKDKDYYICQNLEDPKKKRKCY
jgi:hypothetical protein